MDFKGLGKVEVHGSAAGVTCPIGDLEYDGQRDIIITSQAYVIRKIHLMGDLPSSPNYLPCCP